MPDNDTILEALGWSHDIVSMNGWELHIDGIEDLEPFVVTELEPMTTNQVADTGWFWDGANNQPVQRQTVPARCAAGADVVALLAEQGIEPAFAIQRSTHDVILAWQPRPDFLVSSTCYRSEVEHWLYSFDKPGDGLGSWYGAWLPMGALSRQQLDTCIEALKTRLRYEFDLSTREAAASVEGVREAFVADDSGDTFFDFIRAAWTTVDAELHGAWAIQAA
jgi:hypothetical protein